RRPPRSARHRTAQKPPVDRRPPEEAKGEGPAGRHAPAPQLRRAIYAGLRRGVHRCRPPDRSAARAVLARRGRGQRESQPGRWHSSQRRRAWFHRRASLAAPAATVDEFALALAAVVLADVGLSL